MKLTKKELKFLWDSSTIQQKNLINLLATKNPIWLPYPDSPQLKAYLSDADELFFGGAAGGGKTDLIIGLATTAHRESIVYRREYPQLEGIFRRIQDIIDPAIDSFREGGGASLLTRDRRLVRFGAVQYPKDVKKFQGRPFDLMAFDEITNFHKSQYVFLKTWNRTSRLDQNCRVLCTGNPPDDEEGEWVIDYWAPWLDESHPDYPEEPGKLRWYITINNEDIEVDSSDSIEKTINGEIKKFHPRSRTFIPAKVEDNPVYMKTGYDQTLLSLPDELRVRMYDGKFSKITDDNPFQVIPSEWVRQAMDRWKPYKPSYHDPDNNNKYIEVNQSAIGADPARGGKDYMCIAKRYDNWIDEIVKIPGNQIKDGQMGAAAILKEYEADSGAEINIDVIGIGSSVFDILSEQENLNVRAINVSNKSKKRDKTRKYGFVNLRAEHWWTVREMLDPESGENIMLPPDRELRRELTTPHYRVMTNGIKIESKEDIKKRIARSTDNADAVILSLIEDKKVGILV